MNAAPSQTCTSHLVAVPQSFRSFRSINSPSSPFEVLRDFLAVEVRAPGLKFGAITVNAADYAALYAETRAWLASTHRLDQLSVWTKPGVSSPVLSRRTPRGHAMVEAAHVR